MNVLLQIISLGLTEIVPIEGLIERMKEIFTLNPDAQINIQNLSSEAIQADNDTLALVAKWQEDHGLPVTVTPPDPSAPPAAKS